MQQYKWENIGNRNMMYCTNQVTLQLFTLSTLSTLSYFVMLKKHFMNFAYQMVF